MTSSEERYRVEVLTSVEDLPPECGTIAEELGISTFYYGLEFLRAYEREPIQRVLHTRYLVIRDIDGQFVGFVPCYVQGDPLRALDLAEDEVVLLSHVWHCSDTRLAFRREDPEIAAAVARTMETLARELGAGRYGFINVAEGPSRDMLVAAGFVPRHIDTRYVIDLAAAGDFEGYLQGLRPNARGEYRRQLNRARDAGVRTTVRVPEGAEDPSSLDLFEKLMANVGSAGYYDKERISRFLTYVPSGARIVELHQGEELLGKAVVFLEETKIHAWAGGYDRYEDARVKRPFSSYYLLIAEIIRLGYEAGVRYFEGGRRNGPFKERYGMSPVELDAFIREVAP
ncbi:GNAT family N-acetyltransferase [Streptomyces cyaneus]|uniref:GNAT family N-acetyltransferase n=1 Tax=Streptomyces cyaneus TaxID=1904 RepID=UPI000FF8ACBB|nr:GNAT family N-acetyltransferase [Streptomyces cyaneus]